MKVLQLNICAAVAGFFLAVVAPDVFAQENLTPGPSAAPSVLPSVAPSASPSAMPSVSPSVAPSVVPSPAPGQVIFSDGKTVISGGGTALENPTPTGQTVIMGGANVVTKLRTPSVMPSAMPSKHPSVAPSVFPSAEPSLYLSTGPSGEPSAYPATGPSTVLSADPSTGPSPVPTPETQNIVEAGGTVVTSASGADSTSSPTETPSVVAENPSAAPRTSGVVSLLILSLLTWFISL
jgi:hypothetical protein